MNKRGGIFFIMDAFLASAIITIALLSVLSTSPAQQNSVDDTKNILINYMDFFENTKAYSAQSQVIDELITNGSISDKKENLFEAITELMIKGLQENATKLVEEQTNLILPVPYSIEFRFNNTIIYNRSMETIFTAKQRFSRKKIINYYKPPRKITKVLSNLPDFASPFDDDCKSNFGTDYDCINTKHLLSGTAVPSACYKEYDDGQKYDVYCTAFKEGKLYPPMIIEVSIWV